MIGLRQLYHASDRVISRTPRVVRMGTAHVLAPLLTRTSCPRVLMVEPTNACNGACPLCPVGTRTSTRGNGMLDPSLFSAVMEEVGDRVGLVIMNFAGEPFLHPKLGALIRAGRSHGARVLVGTNGTRDRGQEILEADPSEILFSLDGMTEQVYGKYRSFRDGSGLADVKENLEKLVRTKQRLRAEARIVLQFVVFRHNEHEVDAVVEYGRRVGVDAVDLKPACVNDYFDEDRDVLMARYVPRLSRVTQYRRTGTRLESVRPAFCTFAFNEATLAWNGDVISCCYDTDGSQVLGNVSRERGFLPVWNSERARGMRASILRQDLPLCARCGVTSVRSHRIELSEASTE